MLSATFCTQVAVLGLFIGNLQSFPQDINFGGRQIGFGGQDDDDRLDTKSGSGSGKERTRNSTPKM